MDAEIRDSAALLVLVGRRPGYAPRWYSHDTDGRVTQTRAGTVLTIHLSHEYLQNSGEECARDAGAGEVTKLDDEPEGRLAPEPRPLEIARVNTARATHEAGTDVEVGSAMIGHTGATGTSSGRLGRRYELGWRDVKSGSGTPTQPRKHS